MPTYQYRCTDCGAELEVVQKFSDAALTDCPSCAGSLRKVFNAVGVVFKGSGFYRTDSRNGSTNGSGGADKADKADKAEKADKADKAESTNGADKKPAKTGSGTKETVSAGSGGSSSTANAD